VVKGKAKAHTGRKDVIEKRKPGRMTEKNPDRVKKGRKTTKEKCSKEKVHTQRS